MVCVFHNSSEHKFDPNCPGQLPYLVHDQHVVSSLPSIIKYVSDLRSAENFQYPNANLDLNLTVIQRSQRTAWFAHTESQLGNLLVKSHSFLPVECNFVLSVQQAYLLYSVHNNWISMTGPSLASMYPVPQKYYVAQRIRNGYYPKLQASGLWNSFAEENPTKSPFRKEKIPNLKEGIKGNTSLTQAFEREKVSSVLNFNEEEFNYIRSW